MMMIMTGCYYWFWRVPGVIWSASFAVCCEWCGATRWHSSRVINAHLRQWQSWPVVVNDARR